MEIVNGLTLETYCATVRAQLPSGLLCLLTDSRIKWFFENRYTTSQAVDDLRLELANDMRERN